MPVRDGPSCPGCGLPNYEGLCPVCRGDEQAYVEELQFAFGPWFPDDGPPSARASRSEAEGALTQDSAAPETREETEA